MEHQIKLIGGYKDTKGKLHQEVTFGKRPTVGDLIVLDNNPQARNPTQYGDLILRMMITKFGSLKSPVNLPVLLALDSIDRDDLTEASAEFLRLSREEREAVLESNQVKLYFGFKIEEVNYDMVTFGNRITGKDSVEADSFGNGVARTAFLIGKQIAKLTNSESGLTIEGTVELERFNELDAEDFNIIKVGAELFRQSFRLKGKGV